MASMVIRNIPDDLMTRVKEAAKREGKSAEQIGREALAEKMKPSREELMRQMEQLRSRSKPVDAETMLRIMRESRAERDARPFLPEDER